MALHYFAYGLRICANLPIPGPIAQARVSHTDVRVWLGLMPSWMDDPTCVSQQIWYVTTSRDEQDRPTLRVWEVDGGYFRLLYGDGTEFIVDKSGTEIWARWPDDLTLEDTATYLLGPVLGFVLRLRGVTCMHASAIAVGDQAIVLLGAAGAGKSTTAAAFGELGYSVLSDDVTVLSDMGDHFLVQPAYPRVRLWPESVNVLYGSSEALPRLTPTWDKRYLDLTKEGYHFQRHPLPLAAIYILSNRIDDPRAPFVEAVASRETLISLIANTYTNYLLDKIRRAQEFELLNRIIEGVPVRRAIPHTNPAYLSKLCDVLIDDFQTLTQPALICAGAEQG